MPELPEVETISQDLNHYLIRQIVESVNLIGPETFISPSLLTIKKHLLGKKIISVFRRAKMVVIEFETYYLVIHLKMTGQLIYSFKNTLVAGGHPIVSTGVTVPNKFTRLIITFKNKGILYFNDIRKFGWVKLLTKAQFKELDNKTGLEPLGLDFTLSFFKSLMTRRGRTPIKATLLDQKYLVGLGNIYVDEVLFRAKVRPSRATESLANLEIKKIWQSIPVILKQSIKQRGTTFSNYIDSDGLKGNFMNFLKVYGRGGKPCLVCGQPLRKTRLAGRGTHWCQNCQK